jgi:signal transduction histidine kinase
MQSDRAVERATVMIADDDEALREALGDLIDAEDSLDLVGTAADADEAIAMAIERQPDVALLDVKMPGGGGPRAAREIRAACPRTRVVALSAHEERTTVLEMLRAGADGYLVKGTTADEVLDAVNRASRGQSSLSTEVTADVIHELVELVDRSEKLSRELHDLDRNKSELIQVLSHELMTPITVIQGTASMLTLGGGVTEDDARALAASVAGATERLRRLVANLSTTARLDRDDAGLSTRPVSARRLVADAATAFPDDRIVVSGEDVELWADGELASRGLSLVIENALDLSDEPVEIVITAGPLEVAIAVADRGPGVPPELHDRIFRPFTQVEEAMTRTHEGLGIGLYLARKVMSAHHGRIEVEPRPGGGTIFRLVFLVAPAALATT